MVKLMVVIGFLVAFGAGMAVRPRILPPETHTTPASRPSGPTAWLRTELSLSPEQEEQLKRIWSETAHRGGREQDERRRQFRKERDDAIQALIRPADKETYEQITKAYADRNAAMEKEWRASFQAAVERTKQILTPEQRRRYEELLRSREAERAAREHEQGRRVDERATSRPGTDK